MTKHYYLVNKLQTNLTVKGGEIDIAVGGYATISENDLKDPTIEWVINPSRGWADVSDTIPKAAKKAGGIEIDVTKPYEGMTADELKADKATKVEVPAASGTALGRGEEETKEEVKPKKAK